MNNRLPMFWSVTAALWLTCAVALADEPTDATDLRDLGNCHLSSMAEADQLKVGFDSNSEAGSIKAWLIGYKQGAMIWKKPLPLVEQVNLAKTTVDCRKGKIYVVSQFPGSAAYISQIFSFDGKVARLVAQESGDPSKKQVDSITAIAKNGTRDQLDDWASGEHAIFYPGNYINVNSVDALLSGGYKTALVLDKAGKPALAAERIEICFDASKSMVCDGMGGIDGCDDEHTPSKWISVWTNMEVPASAWAPKLNDYAFFLQKCGKHQKAISVLRAVLKAQPERQAAYLNIADSYWALHQKKSALENYHLYVQLMEKNKLSNQIPSRVIERIKS